jgi:hypothetical protein
MVYGFYTKLDKNEEIINRIVTFSRLQAAKLFAERKQLSLKSFLKIYSVKKVL